MRTMSAFQESEAAARRERVAEYDRFADERDTWRARNAAYYRAIERLVGFVVPKGASVLEVGCGTGDLLAALKPEVGVGIDLSPRMIELARAKHPGLELHVDDAERLESPALAGRTFDYVVISDVVGVLDDIWSAFRALRRVCHPRTRVIVTYYNFVWEPLLTVADAAGNGAKKQPMSTRHATSVKLFAASSTARPKTLSARCCCCCTGGSG